MMQNTDMSTLLTASLVEMGCDPALIADLDAQSDIVLDFHDMPSIHLLKDGESVRLWAALGQRHDYRQLLETRGGQIALELTEPQPYAHGGALMLQINDETLQVTALVHPDYLVDSKVFGEALNAFFVQLTGFNQIIGA
jgi:hypothetical protein